MAFSSASMSRSNMRRCDALFFTAVKSQLQWLGSDERSFLEILGIKNWGGDAEKNGPHNFQRAKIELLVLQRVTALSEFKKTCLSLGVKLLPFLQAPRKMSLGSGVSKGFFHGNLTMPLPKCHLFFLGNKALLTTIIPYRP